MKPFLARCCHALSKSPIAVSSSGQRRSAMTLSSHGFVVSVRQAGGAGRACRPREAALWRATAVGSAPGSGEGRLLERGPGPARAGNPTPDPNSSHNAAPIPNSVSNPNLHPYPHPHPILYHKHIPIANPHPHPPPDCPPSLLCCSVVTDATGATSMVLVLKYPSLHMPSIPAIALPAYVTPLAEVLA